MGEKVTQPKWWVCTIPRGEMLKDGRYNPYYGYTATEIGEMFDREGADRWVIGEERGEDGYEHWQCKIVFSKGKNMDALMDRFKFAWWQPATTHTFEYEEKQGKFVRSWELALTKHINVDLWDWQKDLLAKLDQAGERQIVFIMDGKGGSGKTFLAKYLTATHQGAYCPPLPEALDYMAWALAHKTAKTFVIDLPRAEAFAEVKKEAQLWSAIEQMKNGYLFDKRHEWREAWIEPPKIIVFGNFEPRWGMLSGDRWITGKISNTKERKRRYIEWM